MRLNRFLIDSIRRFARGERGSAMAAVLGLLGVTTVVGLTITAVTVNAIGYTSSTRADIQSRAAAEAGIDVTEAGLRTTGDCATHNGVYTSATAPKFSTQVSYKTAGNWITGCPIPTSTSVRVVSVGTAAAAGVNGASAGNTTSLEAIYAFIPATGSITATGGAVRGATVGLNQVTLTQNSSTTTPSSADVHITSPGNYTCQSGTIITGNLIVEKGSVELNGCIVLGSIRASGYVAVNSGTNRVGGDVVAGGSVLYNSNYAAQVGPGSTVVGNVIAGGKVYIDGKVNGSVTGVTPYSLLFPLISTITPSARIGGSLNLSGGFSTWSVSSCPSNGILTLLTSVLCNLTGVVTGVVNVGVTSLTAPSAPAATNWVPYTYNKVDWTNAGFTELVMPADQCFIDNNPVHQVFINAIMAATTPVVVNALGCAKVTFSSSAALQLKLKTDVAFISKSFGLENLNISTAVTAGVRTWFVVPALVPVTLCADVNGKVDINSSVSVSLKVSALIYTPGCISSQTNNWHGQFYAGTVAFNTQTTFDFVPVGLPGVDLGGGTVVTTTTGGVLGSRTSLRDLAG